MSALDYAVMLGFSSGVEQAQAAQAKQNIQQNRTALQQKMARWMQGVRGVFHHLISHAGATDDNVDLFLFDKCMYMGNTKTWNLSIRIDDDVSSIWLGGWTRTTHQHLRGPFYHRLAGQEIYTIANLPALAALHPVTAGNFDTIPAKPEFAAEETVQVFYGDVVKNIPINQLTANMADDIKQDVKEAVAEASTASNLSVAGVHNEITKLSGELSALKSYFEVRAERSLTPPAKRRHIDSGITTELDYSGLKFLHGEEVVPNAEVLALVRDEARAFIELHGARFPAGVPFDGCLTQTVLGKKAKGYRRNDPVGQYACNNCRVESRVCMRSSATDYHAVSQGSSMRRWK
ncbi:hypothetical protein P153DRAFT_429148 [Dothidotthia symphoricarpi CBS 119687]|uniref:Uncharacterized protein n=1 Tax=Dothidotthia symphoricarpi CBS 119687 TaxID=1392245 RepID=A0A6A6ALZ7_9PLEO|nr:uncharacterized protein P153DRAFT_429148 [Dothidotthia symphoricarpi CBS 119687]KAF2131907.1 hypothetical protein P153DRAFT_429148 [Dothidotthia symphoricarpi CBS 119687]